MNAYKSSSSLRQLSVLKNTISSSDIKWFLHAMAQVFISNYTDQVLLSLRQRSTTTNNEVVLCCIVLHFIWVVSSTASRKYCMYKCEWQKLVYPSNTLLHSFPLWTNALIMYMAERWAMYSLSWYSNKDK